MFASGRFVLAGTVVLVSVLGCSREPVEGTVYVIKGAGNVVRAAAVPVHVVPYESLEAFENARLAASTRIEGEVLAEYVDAACRTFESTRSDLLKRKSNELAQYAPGCTPKDAGVAMPGSERTDPAKIRTALAQQREERAALQQAEAADLAREAAARIKVSYAYAAGAFGKVQISNGSDHWIIGGQDPHTTTVSGFVRGVRVISCQGQPAIAPGETLEIDLGACVTDSASLETLFQKELARVCRKTGYLDVPCFDDFGPEAFDLDTAGNYRRSDWTFVERKERPSLLDADHEFVEIDFRHPAEQSKSIRAATSAIEALEASLAAAELDADRRSYCDSLVAQVDLLENGECPEADQGRSVVSQFGRDLAALGMRIAELPTPQEETIATFAIANASTIERTNVDGQFSLAAPPRGTFLIYAAYSDSFSALEWLVPVAGDATTIELNNTNALDVHRNRLTSDIRTR